MKRKRFTEEQIILVLREQSAVERVTTFLMSFLRPQDDQGCAKISLQARSIVSLPISRPYFSAHLGTTAETISRSFHLLAHRGVIRIIDSEHFEVIRRMLWRL